MKTGFYHPSERKIYIYSDSNQLPSKQQPKRNLTVSYWANEVSEMTISDALYDIKGITYIIVDADGSDAESMFAMAEKVIRAE